MDLQNLLYERCIIMLVDLASMYQTKYGSVLYGGLQQSRQNQKPHGKNKIRPGKTKNLTAKPNTSHSKNKIALVLPWVFAFFHSIWFCREVFGFAVRFLVLP